MGFGAKLALVFAAVAASTAMTVGAASYVTTDRQVLAEVDNFLEERAEEIIGGKRQEPNNRRDEDRRNDRTNDDGVIIGVTPDAEVQVITADGVVESNSGLLLPVDENDRELADKEGPAILRTVDIGGVDYRLLTVHFENDRALQVARSLDETASLLDALQPTLLLIAAGTALLAGVAGWALAQRTTKPLRALTDAVDEVAETRDFSVPVDARGGRDEIGRLGRGFNRMLDALHTSEEQQRRLVQDAAHELRTPLTSITANVDWLMRAPDLDPDARAETLQSVKRELTELNGVIAEIIELATDSRQAPELRATELDAVVAAAVEQFRQRSGRLVDVSAAPITVLGDSEGLARAVTNLLSNADKYSPPGASIGVVVGPQGVFVDDAGPGIPAEERARVFDRFYRRDEDRSKPGSGLGLSIVASIVDQHGGRVGVGDSPLGGARVGFTLPSS